MNNPQIISAIIQATSIMLSIVVLICMTINKHYRIESDKQYIWLTVCNTLAISFDLFALIFRLNDWPISYIAVRICNFLAYSFNFLLITMFFRYIYTYILQKTKLSKIPIYVAYTINTIYQILLIINVKVPIFYSFTPQYQRSPLFWLSQVPGILSLIAAIILITYHRKKFNTYELVTMYMYTLFPFIAVIVQSLSYGIMLISFGNTISCVIMFIFLQAERERKITEKENEYLTSQINVTLSQVQPHFLNNALNTIQYLCDTDPAKASEVVGNFSKYIRMNIDSISNHHPIPLSKDLEHLQNYLSIETLRFPDIRFEYDIQVTDFSVPPLTLQPLVENAIKHGVRQRESGGVVRVSTLRESGNNIIVIEDNGGGFDINKKPDDNRSHIGLSNTQKRIKIMCNGKLKVESKIDYGTKITIKIPVESGVIYENIGS